jgi:hypothetical protein
MKINGVSLRVTLAVAGAGCASMILGCLNQRHLIGEGGPPDAGAGSDAGTGGTAGSSPIQSDGGGGGTGGSGGPAPAPDGGGGNRMPDAALPDATVVGLGDEVSGGWPIAISPAEVARRLSQFILQQPPTNALTVAIVAAAPRTNQDVGQLAEGLLLQAGSLAGRQAFYRWWLRLDALTQVTRDATLFPLFTDGVRLALIDQTLAFAEDVTWRPVGGDLWTLLTEPTAFVSAATAPWFPGVVPPAGAEAIRVMLDGARYAGIITQPAVLAPDGYPTRPEPSRRGRELRARYLCQNIPPEPPGSPVVPIPAGLSIRQTVERATADLGCAACHSLCDEPGFAFGHFDAVGAYQDSEGGLPIDTAGVLMSYPTRTETAFAGPGELARLLGDSPDVGACFAAKWLTFATSAGADPDTVAVQNDGSTLAIDNDYVVKRATIRGRLNLRGTIRAVTETHTFLDP